MYGNFLGLARCRGVIQESGLREKCQFKLLGGSMFAEFVTKTKADGSIVIDKDRSFLALVEAFEPQYEDLVNKDDFSSEMQALFANPNQLIELIENDEGDDVDGLIYAGIIFYIADSDHRNIEVAVSLLKNSERFDDDFFKSFCNYVLGILYCCAPSGLKHDKNVALSYLRKAQDIDQETAEKFGVAEAIETIVSTEGGNSLDLVPTSNAAKASANLQTTSNSSVTSAAENKNKGVWVTVFNVAVNALSKISAEKLNDPVFMRKALGKAYELLPFWVRAVVSEELFFNFCFDRRSLILERLATGQSSFQANEAEVFLPRDDEQPVISKDTVLVNIVESHSGNLFSEEKFYFFPTPGSDKFNNAYESYIKEALEKYGIAQNKDGLVSRSLKAVGVFKNELPEELGIPLFMYDSTAFGSCKTGFLITSKTFIVKEMMTKPMLIKLNQIKSFELKKSFLSAGKIYINDQMVIDCNQGKKDSFHKFSVMFDEIVGAA